MSTWQHLAPTGGWGSFTESAALTTMLWAQHSAADWHYLNLATGSSIWESRQDASSVLVHYEGECFVEFAVQLGAASESVAPLALQFQLSPVTPAA